ncbi:MAG: hypothetical protein ING08_16025 [Roseomonas sp.]|nr:hypothetical protein [Roseomonas sp.]
MREAQQPGEGQQCQRRANEGASVKGANHFSAPTKRRKLSPVITLVPPIFRISSFPLAARRRMVERLQGPRRTAWEMVKASACGFGSGRFGESLGIFSTFRESRISQCAVVLVQIALRIAKVARHLIAYFCHNWRPGSLLFARAKGTADFLRLCFLRMATFLAYQNLSQDCDNRIRLHLAPQRCIIAPDPMRHPVKHPAK